MPRILKITLCYDGSDFAGWQRQPGLRTVQAVLEDALQPFAATPVAVIGASRTDAGVHAASQVASVAIQSAVPADDVRRALNATLPLDVRVLTVADVAAPFDARHHARRKTYRYLVWNGRPTPPLVRRMVWPVTHRLDLAAMNDAAARLIGRHDFAAFQSAGGTVITTTRELFTSAWQELPWSADPLSTFPRTEVTGRLLRYEVSGTGFLRHMVRTIVGTLIDVGRGRLLPDDVERILATARRATAGQTAPAQGLLLWHIDY